MSDKSSSTAINADNLWVLENLYERFQEDPGAVPEDWIRFFQSFDADAGNGSRGNGGGGLYIPKLSQDEAGSVSDINLRAMMLLQAYRRNGHFSARIDPLEMTPPSRYNLALEEHGLSEGDLDREITTRIAGSWSTGKLRDFVERMEKTYCSSLAADFFYIRNEEQRTWLMERMEADANRWKLSENIRLLIYEKLFSAEYFEKFLARHYVGKKRFSLEGAESLIPVIAAAVEISGNYDIEQIVLGMAHRGRLNVLRNVMEKDPALMFAEFNENVPDDIEAGDVKYHLGYSNDIQTLSGRKVHLSLAFNPSHLEVINPVVLGSVRARQTRAKDAERAHYLPLLIHGDAAFAGQGINYEILNMSKLPGYFVGGALHIIVNNQIGFTTSPHEARTTQYCTDVAKMLQVPVFHVNADDPEACYRAVQLCMEWRKRYRTDAFLDLVCYRRWGHNETDEPSFTQPRMYKRIKGHPTSVAIYEKKLLESGIDESRLASVREPIEKKLADAYAKVQSGNVTIESETLQGDWRGFHKENPFSNPDTGVDRLKLERLGEKLTTLPESFKPNSKIKRLLDQRRVMYTDADGKLDWGAGEGLTYATLLDDGVPIRFSGQDVKRGTFSHRHAALFDAETGDEHIPLNHLSENQAPLEILNSLLSEEAALGFEFGFSLADPRTLVIWEGQFGDFANGAQVIIDQFISSSEAKWNRMSGLVLLLPHGYEGQGPEHSSARLERYLQLCSQNNIQVCNCTTPAQYFHLIRRQIRRDYRKPLVIMSPKSLLRLPEAVSSRDEFTTGKFQEILDDPSADPAKTDRLLLCAGKIYYELLKEKQARGLDNIAIARMEQYYPFPYDAVASLFQKYNRPREVIWVQEEPRNQGAWIFLEHWLSPMIGENQELKYAGRSASPSPATGYFKVHQREQKEIIDLALGLKK